MTDATAHNLGVIEKVCEESNTDKTPSSLVCHIQKIIKDVLQSIHDKLGSSKVKDCFLVDVNFKSESFIYKAIQRLTSTEIIQQGLVTAKVTLIILYVQRKMKQFL